jgi:hypothetical protein
MYYQLFVFHITKTDPPLSAVSQLSPYLRVSFNQSLDAKSLRLDDPSHIISNTSIENSAITMSFDENLILGKTYEITIKQITSNSGKVIKNRVLRFTAKDIPSTKLSSAQQKALVSRQDQYPYTVDYINFVGFDALTDNGLSADQLQAVKRSLYSYSVLAKQEYWTMTLVSSSLQIHLHDSQSDSTVDSQSFVLQVNKTTLHITVNYDIIDDSAQTQIFNDSGTLVYDSLTATN